MAKINFSIKIKNIIINSNIELKGQQLYFFNESSEYEKQEWIKNYLQREMKIRNIKIDE